MLGQERYLDGAPFNKMIGENMHSHFTRKSKVLLIFKDGSQKVIHFLKTEKGIMYDTNLEKYPLKKIRAAAYFKNPIY